MVAICSGALASVCQACPSWVSLLLYVSIGWSVPPKRELESWYQFVVPGAAVVVVVVVMIPFVCVS